MMTDYECPNITTCKLVTNPENRLPEEVLIDYERRFCRHRDYYHQCKRYQAKQELGFCPDFVLPDSPEGIPDIIARFDEAEEN